MSFSKHHLIKKKNKNFVSELVYGTVIVQHEIGERSPPYCCRRERSLSSGNSAIEGVVCVCVCTRYTEISHSWRGNPVLTTCQRCCVGVFVCHFVCVCVSHSKNASFEGMPEPLSEQIKTLNVLYDLISPQYGPSKCRCCFMRLKRDYMNNRVRY